MAEPVQNQKTLKSNLGRMSEFSRSRVDIIIPFHGQYDKVSRLVAGIVQVVRSNPYKITLVDNGSPNKEFVDTFNEFDKNRPVWAEEPIVSAIRLNENAGFAAACKVGYLNTKNPWCLFMHSDCIVEDPLFMLEMGKSLLRLKKQNVRMVVPRTNNVASWFDARLKGKKGERGDDLVIQEGFLPLFCFMVHRELFKHTRGFLKEYPYTGYEDEEFGCRMRKCGFKQAICGRSYVAHEGSATLDAICKENPEAIKIIENNRNLCIADLQKL